MKISNYFAKEKMDDASFIQTYIEKLNDLTEEDICWANSDLEEDHEKVQSSLIQLFHNDRVHPDSLIHNGIGKKELLEILVEMKKRMSH